MATDFRDLRVWQAAMELVEKVYQYTARLPPEERFGLVSQIRRAAVSVPSNIAEGNARTTRGEYVQFLGIARGSLAELETQLLLCPRLGYPSTETLCTDLRQVNRQLQALIRSLKR